MRSGLYGLLRQVSYIPPPAVVAPGQVTGLAAGTATSSSVPLTWSAATGTAPLTYRVEYKRTADGAWITAAGTSATTFTVTGLSASTQYQFRVRAENSAGAGEYSAVVSASTPAAVAAPGAPTNVRTGGGGSVNTIRAMWNQGTGGQPSSYEVWHSREDGQGYKLVGTVNGATLELTYPITFPPTYQMFYVTAVNAAGRASSQPIGVSVA